MPPGRSQTAARWQSWSTFEPLASPTVLHEYSFASDPAGGIEVATALVAGPRVSEFLADLFVRSDPGRPTAVFADPEAALVWALDQVQAHHNR